MFLVSKNLIKRPRRRQESSLVEGGSEVTLARIGPPSNPAYPGVAAGAIKELFRGHGFSLENSTIKEGTLWYYKV